MMRRALVAATAAVALLVAAASPGAAADKFPDRTVKIVVPFAAGGGVDTLARLLAERMQGKLGVNVIVENRAGASGTVGGQSVQQSAPDGYTVLFSSNTHSMAKQVMAKAPYDPLTDFVSIARVGEAPLLTVMATKMPQKTLAEVAAAAKANPDQWTAGTPALGSPSHIATLEFMRITGAKLTITPYRGTAPALTDVAGGHIQLLTDAMVVLLPMARDGKVKGMAVTAAKRSALAPDIPTAAESGVPGLEVKSWYGVWGPLGIPADVVQTLNKAFQDATRELADSGRLKELGVDPVYESPAVFAKFMAADVARNAELLKSVNFQPQ
ncbi:tripartite tricarboxylate transporter substrate binding protein [Rhodoplanes sp. TEM]|uniref:Tripartite tricarboxylate transporter substrate binding protein n=1 Tax=Rhodoplanes tepidamans TaxID=200616 RepID=A0ABT5JAI5_RHOTP|nr:MULTISPECIES: tripartite tricarboxylate transporter substrate binding protein [Rhodoplanes]MDC7786669.1 tripartite tricarboxylate transporter substrate binding protein [Rhodoplanes tepidamans]MDC7982984.1 tripartite tricarboxylate transporter substrate binding protein [Rhodoplanes sp. TEM]MDQ0356366.1 tripartite-type tricarboxylate transporter receptor subunit TctC [Rhodoplanes tepidamans]